MAEKFTPLPTTDAFLAQLQRILQRVLEPLTKDNTAPVILENRTLTLGGAQNKIAHGLNRPIRRYRIVRSDVTLSLPANPADNASLDRSKYLVLTVQAVSSSATTCTVDLEVF